MEGVQREDIVSNTEQGLELEGEGFFLDNFDMALEDPHMICFKLNLLRVQF